MTSEPELTEEELALLRSVEARAAVDWIDAHTKRTPINQMDERTRGLIHAAVSFTYIDTEAARLQTRIALKQAMNWTQDVGDEERLKELLDQK